MDIEDFCTYEQSLALRELGFKEKCLFHYTTYKALEGNERLDTGEVVSITTEDLYKCYNYFKDPYYIDAPTQTDARKWFRKQKFEIEASGFGTSYECWYAYPGKFGLPVEQGIKGVETYEKAVSLGIDACLEILKERNQENYKI